MIPYIYNPLGISNNKSIYPENVSVFSIYGNSLTSMYVTPVENCIIDFGDGNKQILEGTNTPTLVEHTYDIEDEYIIKIMGNHYTFQASKNIIEIIQLSDTVLSYYNIFYDCSNLINISDFFKMYNTVKDCTNMFRNCTALNTVPSTFIFPDSITNCAYTFSNCSKLLLKDIKLSTNLNNAGAMFQNCQNAQLSLSSLPNNLSTATSMFYGCKNAQLPLSSLPNNLVEGSHMFQNCQNAEFDITELANNAPVEGWRNLTDITDMFTNCLKITGSKSVFLSKCTNSNLTGADSAFSNCPLLTD